MVSNIATILPTARTTFVDANDVPLSGGFVYMYVPNTTTPKTTWQDAGMTTPNSNPIVLDSNGSCLLYGSGQYTQEVRDVNNNLVWTGLTQDLYALILANIGVFPTGIPVGAIIAYSGSTPPTGWVFAAGQSLSTSSYATLFNVIGYVYGGSGGNFNVPDLRGRVIAGVDNMGGTPAGLITSAGCGINGTTLGATGGNQLVQTHTHTATVTDPGHFHNVTIRGGSQGAAGSPNYPVDTATSVQTTTATTGVTVSNANYGSGSSQNVQPTIMQNYIIYTGNAVGTSNDIYDLVQFYPGVPTNSATLARFVMVRNIQFEQNFPGSFAISTVAATASTVLNINKNGASVATVTFAASSTTGVIASAGTVTFAAADILSVTNQASADATLANISLSLTGIQT